MVWWKSIETNLLSFSKAEQNPSRLFLTSLKDKFVQLQIFFRDGNSQEKLMKNN